MALPVLRSSSLEKIFRVFRSSTVSTMYSGNLEMAVRDAKWRQLELVINNILNSKSVSLPNWLQSFESIYHLSVQEDEDFLRKKVIVTLERFVKQLSKGHLSSTSLETLLSTYSTLWCQYRENCNCMRPLLLYMDNLDVNGKTALGSFQKLGNKYLTNKICEHKFDEHFAELKAWQTELLQPMAADIVRLLISKILTNQRDEIDNTSIQIMREVGFSFERAFQISGGNQAYRENFEMPFLEGMSECYRKESSEIKVEELGAVKYVEKALAMIQANIDLTSRILNEGLVEEVKSAFVQHYFTDKKDWVLSECDQMVAEERNNELESLYKFLKYIPNYDFEELKSNFKNLVEKNLIASITNLKGQDVHMKFINNLLECHIKYRNMIREIFDDDNSFVTVLDKVFVRAMKKNTMKEANIPLTSAEMLARYCDSILREKDMPDNIKVFQELSYSFKTVFPYIYESDVFEKFYAQLMSGRLIQNSVRSMEPEEEMVKLLQQECGSEYAKKLTTMLTDNKLSSDLTNEFTQTNVIGIKFTIKVSTNAVWPMSDKNVLKFTPPNVIENVMHQFEKFYLRKHNDHKLTWMHHFSPCELWINIYEKRYIATMNTFLLAILLLFQDRDQISFNEVNTFLNTDENTLARHVAILVDSKFLKSDTKEVSAASTFKFNAGYKNKKTIVIIPAASKRVTLKENSKIIKTVEADRKGFLQTVIVRVMKKQKEMCHNDLIAEVISKTEGRFSASASMIKKEIESLIEREYLSRKPDNKNVYLYIA
ncbi:Hypothetical predicted protein [Cloeon dipterum]|uniref:Cullin family profile domain-containing protein n=5 Tax=Cloeon dipterum TaxID=197152 RepID=A0A8S1BU03_9INSE|nr:Hypothetical predicted protein [Cloeon dipterum]